MGVIPVARVALGDDPFVDHPLAEGVGPAADKVLRLGPLIAIAANQHLIDRHKRRVRQHGKEGRVRLGQRHFQGGVVQGFDPQGVGRFFALGDVGGVHQVHVAEVAGIRRGGFRIYQPLPAPDHVLSGDGSTVAPGNARAEMERPDGIVFVLPFFRQLRLDLPFWRDADQPFEQIADNIEFDIAFDLMRIERCRFIAIIPDQFLLLCQLCSCRYAGGKGRCACAKEPCRQQRECKCSA